LVRDLKTFAYWLSLGAAAGGLGGALVGGVGGRLAMFVLRLTSDSFVRGVESDDGFIIGRFNLMDTLELVLATTIMGAVVGVLVIAGRPFFPWRGMWLAWAAVGGAIGGGIIVHTDGVDFVVLEPAWLAVLMFIAIPAAGAAAIAALVPLYQRFWWTKRGPTAIASVAALPLLIFVPASGMVLAVSAVVLGLLQVPALRLFAAGMPARSIAILVFAALVVLGTLDLVRDSRELL
jgi:hypothetical protein